MERLLNRTKSSLRIRNPIQRGVARGKFDGVTVGLGSSLPPEKETAPLVPYFSANLLRSCAHAVQSESTARAVRHDALVFTSTQQRIATATNTKHRTSVGPVRHAGRVTQSWCALELEVENKRSQHSKPYLSVDRAGLVAGELCEECELPGVLLNLLGGGSDNLHGCHISGFELFTAEFLKA